MGLGVRLIVSFLVVILITAFSGVAFMAVSDFQERRNLALSIADRVKKRIQPQIQRISKDNLLAAERLGQDPSFLQAYQSKNRSEVSAAIRDFASRHGIEGFIAIIDSMGRIFFSSETPNKFGDSAQGDFVSTILSRSPTPVWDGPTTFTPTGQVAITGAAPVMIGSRVQGIVTVNFPITTPFLSGIMAGLEVSPDRFKEIDLVVISGRDGRLVCSNGIVGKDRGVLENILRGGPKAIPSQPFEEAGKWWIPIDTAQDDKKMLVLRTLVVMPASNWIGKVRSHALVAAGAALLGLIISMFMSMRIASSINRPLRLLIDRARDLSAQRANMPPLDGLSGEWLELGEIMDTAVSSMRSTVSSLKQQLARHAQDIDEKLRAVEAADQQVNSANRQLAQQGKQLAEISKQVNYANQQAVLLQHKLDAVMQISTEGFMVLDQFGNVLSANPVFLNWFGLSEGEIAGRFCFDLVQKQGTPRLNDFLSPPFSKHTSQPADLITMFYPEGVIYHRQKDKAVEVLVHLQPVVSDDGSIQGYVMVLRDKSLRSEVQQLRNEIVTMLSESIRAPLVSVASIWNTILHSAAQTTHPSVGQSLAQLQKHYEQLLGVVDSLLMMYGGFVPPPALPREQVTVPRLVKDCLEEISVAARERQLLLDYKTTTGLPPVSGDNQTMRSVMIQILEKMMEITAPGGRVRVESLMKGSEMRIGVSSSGPAIDQEEIVDMFAGFIPGKHQEDTYSTRLALYLARNNVERMGGRIWAESEAGRGTSIYYTLPVS